MRGSAVQRNKTQRWTMSAHALTAGLHLHIRVADFGTLDADAHLPAKLVAIVMPMPSHIMLSRHLNTSQKQAVPLWLQGCQRLQGSTVVHLLAISRCALPPFPLACPSLPACSSGPRACLNRLDDLSFGL